MCAMCDSCIKADLEDCLKDILQVLEPATTRQYAPDASICRMKLKTTFGSVRGRYLVDRLLTDRVVPGTKLYPKRHIMFLNKEPMKLRDPELVQS